MEREVKERAFGTISIASWTEKSAAGLSCDERKSDTREIV